MPPGGGQIHLQIEACQVSWSCKLRTVPLSHPYLRIECRLGLSCWCVLVVLKRDLNGMRSLVFAFALLEPWSSASFPYSKEKQDITWVVRRTKSRDSFPWVENKLFSRMVSWGFSWSWSWLSAAPTVMQATSPLAYSVHITRMDDIRLGEIEHSPKTSLHNIWST